MWNCINCGEIEPMDNNGNKHCPICGLKLKITIIRTQQ